MFMYEYKILTQKDKWFTGKFDPQTLEKAINAYAQNGWRVKGVSTAEIASGVGNREEMIVILERKIPTEKSYEVEKLEDIILPSL